MKKASAHTVLLCALIAAGLLFDPMGLLRMTLFCALVHEGGHILAFAACTHRLPHLRACIGGITLYGAGRLSVTQERFVVCAGPLANFLLTAALLACTAAHASYRAYFLAAVSLCTGLYNLLPFGVLDGARILQALIPSAGQNLLVRAQRTLFGVLCTALLCAALAGKIPSGARAAALLGPLYLLTREKG